MSSRWPRWGFCGAVQAAPASFVAITTTRYDVAGGDKMNIESLLAFIVWTFPAAANGEKIGSEEKKL